MAWVVWSAIRDILVTLSLNAFVDDTNLIHGADRSTQFSAILSQVQANLDLWHGLLQASGSILSHTKCSWTLFVWSYDKYGTAKLNKPPNPISIYTTDRVGNTHLLKLNKPSDAVCLLGVQITAHGNLDKELQVLMQRQTKYAQFLLWTSLTPWEAQTIYKQCYLPTVIYPLPVMSMPIQKIYNTQVHITSIFLSRMGYSQNMLGSVVYAPESVGRLGFCHLGFKQGVQQVLHILWHLHANTTNGNLYSIMIDSYQIFAGISQPILQDARPLPWLLHRWISSVRDFLYLTGNSIHLSGPWTPCAW